MDEMFKRVSNYVRNVEWKKELANALKWIQRGRIVYQIALKLLDLYQKFNS